MTPHSMYAEWKDADVKDAVDLLKASVNTREALAQFNKTHTPRSIVAFRQALRNKNVIIRDILGMNVPQDVRQKAQISKDKDQGQVKILQKEVEQLRREALSADKYVEIINGFKKAHSKIPDWLIKKDTKGNTGIPVLFLSDAHDGETVKRAQINGVNYYDMAVCAVRMEHTFKTAISLTMDYMKDPQYPGAVLALGGDFLSGNIHEELEATNEEPILKTLMHIEALLAAGIESMARTYRNLFIPCVVGNHGRIREKKRYKNRVCDNYDWLLYHMLSKRFASYDGSIEPGTKRHRPHVTFFIPESPDVLFSIYEIRFLLNHGDEFKGGSGISGIQTPLALGRHRKLTKQTAMNNSFDLMLIGHFHQYYHSNGMIINGSIKGYDEFANGLNLPYERPQQALFIVHPTMGITYRMPVLCDGYETKNKEWKGNAIKTF